MLRAISSRTYWLALLGLATEPTPILPLSFKSPLERNRVLCHKLEFAKDGLITIHLTEANPTLDVLTRLFFLVNRPWRYEIRVINRRPDFHGLIRKNKLRFRFPRLLPDSYVDPRIRPASIFFNRNPNESVCH
jgi:hypothetical protein